MYLTAHHVTSTDRQREGVNAFAHMHGTLFPSEALTPVTLQRVADELPGELVAEWVEVPPGGNIVRSYLDVVTPDDTPPEQIEEALNHFEQDLATLDFPMTKIIDRRIAIRIGMNIGIYARRQEEFQMLKTHLLSLMARLPR